MNFIDALMLTMQVSLKVIGYFLPFVALSALIMYAIEKLDTE